MAVRWQRRGLAADDGALSLFAAYPGKYRKGGAMLLFKHYLITFAGYDY